MATALRTSPVCAHAPVEGKAVPDRQRAHRVDANPVLRNAEAIARLVKMSAECGRNRRITSTEK
jgi:hypothetical protein